MFKNEPNSPNSAASRRVSTPIEHLPDDALVRKKSLLALVPVSPTTLWRMIRDGQFPKAVQLSDSGRCPAWRLGDVRRWLAARSAV